jgi:hypothetical protein
VGDGLWSPSVAGDTVAVEVYLPAGLTPNDVTFGIPRLSHMMAAPGQPGEFGKALEDIGGSEACHIDVRCQTVPDSMVNSVAKLIITDQTGQAGFCTGTLLADSDPATQTPYLLTADHCGVGNAQVAANIELYWFFERATCGGANPDTVTRTLGGGAPLSASPQFLGNDHALLRLNQPPPPGVVFSGWSVERTPLNTPMVGVHHPNGDLKKISNGTVINYASVAPGGPGAAPGAFGSISDGVGPYLEIQWQNGVTQGGSSGSGIWRGDSGAAPGGPYLVGALLGGGSTCNEPQITDVYGSFDLTYKATRFWLTGSADYSTIWQDTSRSGQGVQLLQNGNVIQGAWYTYDANGQPMWLTFVANLANGAASAPLLRFTGPALGAPWTNPSAVEAGQANLSFTSPTSVSFNYTVDGVTDTLTLTPFTSLSAGGFTGVWWDPATPGQGVQLIQGGTQLSGAWYLYDGTGTGRWFTFVVDTTSAPLVANLLSFTGPPLGQPWDPGQVQFSNGGQVTLTPATAASIRMDYSIGPVQGTLNLVPFNP